jgi:hypothetical protein
MSFNLCIYCRCVLNMALRRATDSGAVDLDLENMSVCSSSGTEVQLLDITLVDCVIL